MTAVTFRRVWREAGMQAVISNAALEVGWNSGGELVVRHPDGGGTRIAGGPLLELLPLRGLGRPHIFGSGRAAEAPEMTEPIAIHDAHGTGQMLRWRLPVAVQPLEVEYAVRLYDAHTFARVDMALRNSGRDPVRVQRLFPFVSGAWWGAGAFTLHERQRDFAVYKQGWQSWSYAGGLPPGVRDPRPHVPALLPWYGPSGQAPHRLLNSIADVVSDEVALIGYEGGAEALLLGFLECRDWLGQIYAQRHEGALAACVLTDAAVLNPGDTLVAPALLLALGRPSALLPEYADAVARELHARPAQRVPTGWCSWYTYSDHVSERDIVENLRALQSVRGMLPLDVVQIDDGYQTAVGDWTSVRPAFPHGMRALVNQIHDAGYRAGLWLAPFTVAAQSHLAREHPDWLIHTAAGRPTYGGKNWGTHLYGLDTSHPGARDWLRSLIATLVEDWGFDYLKLDFLASAALPGQWYDPAMTRARALRSGLTLIREAAGEQVFLLGCGCPLLSAVGLVDAMRIGPDSAPFWGMRYRGVPLPASEGHMLAHMEGAVRNTLMRAWMHPALWVNDPDCLLARVEQTELTPNEVRTVATAIGLTGGMVLLSDRLVRLPLERLGLAAKLLPPMAERAQPLDCFAEGIPERVSVVISRPWGRWLLVGLFNSAHSTRSLAVRWSELGLAPGRYHSVEFWSETYLGISDTGESVRVGPHGAAVLAVHPVSDEPQLLATSFHLTQGAAEIAAWEYDAEARQVRWHARIGRQAAGTFTLWLPHGLHPVRIASDALRAEWHRSTRGEIVISAEIRGEAHFTLEIESRV